MAKTGKTLSQTKSDGGNDGNGCEDGSGCEGGNGGNNCEGAAAAGRCVVIGLTGGSGSGKSEAAKILARLGARVIDADAVARAVTGESATLAELAREFGGWVIDGRGAYNRPLVAERAFSDREFLGRLTEITHKYIIKEIYRRVDEIKSDPSARVIVIDAPLPVKEGFLDISDAVWVVKSGRAERLRRVMARDGVAAGAAGARFSSQMSDGEYEAIADAVIENDGDLSDLEAELRRQYRLLRGD